MKFDSNNTPTEEALAALPEIPAIPDIDAAIYWYRSRPVKERKEIDNYLGESTGVTITRLYLWLKGKK
jgi:hypothetical protein